MLGEFRRTVLANGLRVLGVENPALHSFVCSLYVHAGPRFESDEQIGLTHFLEHMLMQGSQNFPSSHAIMRGIEDLGGIVDASTHAEYVIIVFGVHRKHWRRAMDIAGDVLLRPLFDEVEIEQEKRIVTEELSHYRDRDGRNISAAELAYGLIFGETLDEAGTRGTPAILERFDRPMLQDAYSRFFTPRNMVLCLAGGLDFDEVMVEVDSCFGTMEPVEYLPQLRPSELTTRRARSFYRATEALPVAEAMLCHHACALGDSRLDAVRAAGHMLGGGLSSRLFARVREELGLVYDIGAGVNSYSDAGTVDISFAASEGNVVDATSAALDVVKQAAADGFTEAELERYREGVRCGMEMLCDQPTHLADWFGKQELLLGPGGVVTPEEYVRRQEALTVEEIGEDMRNVFAGDGGNLVVVGPLGMPQLAALRERFPAEEADVTRAPGETATGNSERGST